MWVLHRINKYEGDETLPLPDFVSDVVKTISLKYSKEGRLSSSHVGMQNIQSNICYNDTKHYQLQSVKNKAAARCAKRTLDAAT